MPNYQMQPNQPPQPQQPQQRQIQVKIPDEILKGVYANTMAVVHSKEDFTLDFMNLFPHQGMGTVVARVITSPGHMKRLVVALKDNLDKYEKQHGKIEESKEPEGMGFRTA